MERSFPQDFDSLTFLYYSIWCKKSSSCVIGWIPNKYKKQENFFRSPVLCSFVFF